MKWTRYYYVFYGSEWVSVCDLLPTISVHDEAPWSLKIELDPALEESDTSTGLLDRREMEEISCVWVWCWHFKRCRRSCLEWWWWPRSKPSPWLTQTSWPTACSRCQWPIHNSPTKSTSRTAAANVPFYSAVWKFLEFPVTKILCEIKVSESWRLK